MSIGNIVKFQNGPIEGVVFRPLRPCEDARGWLTELFRQDELDRDHYPVMAYVSQTLPAMSRGPHEHRRQTDLIAFVGPGDCKLYLWDNRENSPTEGNRRTAVVGQSNQRAVLIPPGVVHAYRNLSETPVTIFNFPNQLYAGEGKREPVDEIRYEDHDPGRFVLD